MLVLANEHVETRVVRPMEISTESLNKHHRLPNQPHLKILPSRQRQPSH